MGSVKLSFLLIGGKRCSQVVPINVAETIPLFKYRTGFSEESSGIFSFTQPTTLRALELYWKFYKKHVPFPLLTSLQDKCDFIKLATYLGELECAGSGMPCGVLSETDFTDEDLRCGYYSSNVHSYVFIRSAGGLSQVLQRAFYHDLCDIYESLDIENDDSYRFRLSNGRILYRGDALNDLQGLKSGDTLELVKSVDTPYEFFTPKPQKWHRKLMIEKETRDALLTLQLCCRRMCGGKFPTEILSMIIGPVYEDWNRIVFQSFQDFSDTLQMSLIEEYMNACFGEDGRTLGSSIFTKWSKFMTTWPQMAKYIWENANRGELVIDLNIPTKRRAGFIKESTVEGVFRYLDRVYPSVKNDAEEADLRRAFAIKGVSTDYYFKRQLQIERQRYKQIAQSWSKVLFKRK